MSASRITITNVEEPTSPSPSSPVLGNLTNNENTPNLSPMSKRLSGMHVEKAAKHGNGSNLEHENQMLKTQIEILKAALLGICKDKSISLPVLSQLKNERQQETSPVKAQKQKHSLSKFSTKKGSAQKLAKEYQTCRIDDQENIESSIKQKSSIQPVARRKRGDRKTPDCEASGPAKKAQQSKVSISNQELPLQMTQKPQQVVQQQEDTLSLDQSPQKFQASRNQFTFLKNNSENIFDYSQIDSDSRQDQSQIHIKYARMLEELETQSNNNTIGEVVSDQHKDSDQPDQALSRQPDKIRSRSSGCSKKHHQKNQMSSQFEQKQYYEHELSTLKSELQQFAQEEEKLMSIIESSNKGSVCESADESVLRHPKIIYNTLPSNQSQSSPQNEGLKIPQTQEREDQDSSFSSVSDRVMKDLEESKQPELTQNQLLKNLKEATSYFNDELQTDDDQHMLRPVKILSPVSFSGQKERPLQDKNKQSVTSQDLQEAINRTPRARKTFEMTPVKTFAPVSAERQSKPKFKLGKIVSPPKQTIKQPFEMQNDSNCELRLANRLSQPKIKRRQPSTSDPQRSEKSISKSSFNRQHDNQSCQITPIKFHRGKIDQDKGSQEWNNDQAQLNNIEMLTKRESLAKGLLQQQEPIEDSFDLNDKESPKSVRVVVQNVDSDDLLNESNFFGLYSKEKGDILKEQRNNSIKKAEELLNNFACQDGPTRRPGFMAALSSKKPQQQEKDNSEPHWHAQEQQRFGRDEENYMTPLIGNEKSPVSPSQQPANNQKSQREGHSQFNEVSFQNQMLMDQKSLVSQCALNSHRSNFSGPINIEIPVQMTPSKLGPESPRLQPEFIQSKHPYQHYQGMSITSNMTQIVSARDTAQHFQQRAQTDCQKRIPTSEELQMLQQSVNKRKSSENTKSQRSHNAHKLLDSNGYRMIQPSPFSTKNKARLNQTLSQGKKAPNAQGEGKEKDQDWGQAYYLNNTKYDPEILYQQRSVSVLKRRDELQRQAQQDKLTKIQAKYQRIEQLKDTKNLRLPSTKNSKSLNRTGKQSFFKQGQCTQNISNVCNQQLDSSSLVVNKCLSQYNSTQRGTDEQRQQSSQNKPKEATVSTPTAISKLLTNLYGDKAQPSHKDKKAMNQPMVGTACRDTGISKEKSAPRQPKSEARGKHFYARPKTPIRTVAQNKHCSTQVKQQILQKAMRLSNKPQNENQLGETLRRMQLQIGTGNSNEKSQINKESTLEHESGQKKSKFEDTDSSQVVMADREKGSYLNSSRSIAKNLFELSSAYSSRQGQTISHAINTPIKFPTCDNCMRLLSKGLSVDFCLKHGNSPTKLDE